MSAAQDELTKALSCLFIAVDSSVAMNVGNKVRAVIDENYAEIASLRHQIETDFMSALVIKHEQRLVEARRLIGTIGWTSSERTDVIRDAEKWLEGTR